MRVKSYLLAASLCCIMPFMAQGADLDDIGDPPGPPRVARRSIAPINVETDFCMLTVQFRSNLGEVYICLQEVTGAVKYSQPVDTSVQNQAILVAPSETYILTILGTAGNVIHQESIFIP